MQCPRWCKWAATTVTLSSYWQWRCCARWRCTTPGSWPLPTAFRCKFDFCFCLLACSLCNQTVKARTCHRADLTLSTGADCCGVGLSACESQHPQHGRSSSLRSRAPFPISCLPACKSRPLCKPCCTWPTHRKAVPSCAPKPPCAASWYVSSACCGVNASL